MTVDKDRRPTGVQTYSAGRAGAPLSTAQQPHSTRGRRDHETQRGLRKSTALGQGSQGKAGPLAGSALKSTAPRSQRGMGVEEVWRQGRRERCPQFQRETGTETLHMRPAPAE